MLPEPKEVRWFTCPMCFGCSRVFCYVLNKVESLRCLHCSENFRVERQIESLFNDKNERYSFESMFKLIEL